MSKQERNLSPGQRRERRKPPTELEPVLETGGKRLPGGNPPVSKHSPTYRSILSMDGDKIAVLERITSDVYGNSSGVEVKYKDKVIRTPELWKEQHRTRTLTHALRLLQLASFNREGFDRAWQEVSQGLSPQELLKESGLSESAAKNVVTELAKFGLLKEKQRTAPGRRSQVFWCVNVQVGAIAPDNTLVGRRSLFDGWGLPEGGPERPPVSNDLPAESAARHELLGKAWEIIQSKVPADAVIENNVAVFRYKGSIKQEIAERLGITDFAATTLLTQLHAMDKQTNRGGGHGTRSWQVSMEQPVINPAEVPKHVRKRAPRVKRQAQETPETGTPEAQAGPHTAVSGEPPAAQDAVEPEQLILQLVQKAAEYKSLLAEKTRQVESLEGRIGELEERLANAERPQLSEDIVRMARETLS